MTEPYVRTMQLLGEVCRIINERDNLPPRQEVFNELHWCVVATQTLVALGCNVSLINLKGSLAPAKEVQHIGSIPVETHAFEVLERFQDGARSHLVDRFDHHGAEDILWHYAQRLGLPSLRGPHAVQDYNLSSAVVPASSPGALGIMNPDMRACIEHLVERLRAMEQQEGLDQATPPAPHPGSLRRF